MSIRSALKDSSSLNSHEHAVVIRSVTMTRAELEPCEAQWDKLRAALIAKGFPAERLDSGEFTATENPTGDGILVECDL